MKVLQINTVYAKGSTGRIVTSIEKVCNESGIVPIVAFGFSDIHSGENLYNISDWISTRVHEHIYSRIFDSQGFGSYFSTLKLLKWIDIQKPDIIHLHNLHGNYININLLVNYINTYNLPVIWTLHDCWPITGHCTHFDYIGCEKWKKGCYRCPLSKEYPSSLCLDLSHRNYRKKKELFTSIKHITIVPVSEWLASQIRMSFLKDYHIQVIYN